MPLADADLIVRGRSENLDIIVRSGGPPVDGDRSGICAVTVAGHHHHGMGSRKVGRGIDLALYGIVNIAVFALALPISQRGISAVNLPVLILCLRRCRVIPILVLDCVLY